VGNFQEIVMAWSKLASVGARPLAESVGIDRDFFARALNKRRELPEQEAKLLGDALDVHENGFGRLKIQSNLCRQLEDLSAVEDLGFKITYLANIKTQKEVRGGKSLQKYLLVHFKYGGIARLSVLRMATEKWMRLMEKIGFPDLPIVEVNTHWIALLNSIDEQLEPEVWDLLIKKPQDDEPKLLLDEDEVEEIRPEIEGPNVSAWLKRYVEDVFSNHEKSASKISMVKTVHRQTELSRMVDKQSALAEWPEAAKEFAHKFVIAPIATEFLPAMAVGIRSDQKRVCLYLASMNDKEILRFDAEFKNKVDHVLIFLTKPWASSEKYEVHYDGPVEQLYKATGQCEEKQNTGISLSAKDIHYLDKDIQSNQRLMQRNHPSF
jgi:cell fate (sporulation/competence/biofilm development) regulator YmcA (YheA/YmcA/DUF963 family)